MTPSLFRLACAACLFALALSAVRTTADEPKKADLPEDKSIVPATFKSASTKVENGSAFDKAVIDLGDRKKMAVPAKAEVIRKGEGTKVEVFMKKSMTFQGHPPREMSIREGRKLMGCATKVEDGVLVVATFGEWESKEGGATVSLVLIIPEKVEVEKRATLAGPKSSARPESGPRGSVAEGWKALKAEPDTDHRAEPAKNR